ncbi:hypothetical protein SEA_TILLUMS_3 [Arthrobacter phage Tillums]|nr:hypothetical protein SEA_TILLUMS_3 [Arthrobacter phage Tillums]
MSAEALAGKQGYGKNYAAKQRILRQAKQNHDITVININREIAELQATLFKLDPTPERLTAWADTYAMLPEGEG